jgi:hypothetical protein
MSKKPSDGFRTRVIRLYGFLAAITWGAILLLIGAILSQPARAPDKARVTLMSPYDWSGFYAGVINGISSAHAAYFNAGGLGIVIGDGKLPHYGPEQIIETYYKYALCSSIEISLDYESIRNPAYNTDRGPVNVFGLRFHWHF